MRYRIIIETEFVGTRATLKDSIRLALANGGLAKIVPGEIVYVAQDLAETHVLTHDGKTVTQG